MKNRKLKLENLNGKLGKLGKLQCSKSKWKHDEKKNSTKIFIFTLLYGASKGFMGEGNVNKTDLNKIHYQAHLLC